MAPEKVGDSLIEVGGFFEILKKSEILGGFSKYVREYGAHRPLSMKFACFLADIGKNGYICGVIMDFSCR